MDDNTLKAITLLFGLVNTLGIAYIGYLTVRTRMASEESRDSSHANGREIQTVKEQTNGITEKLVSSAYNQGKTDQHQETQGVSTAIKVAVAEAMATWLKSQGMPDRGVQIGVVPAQLDAAPPPDTPQVDSTV